MLLSLEIRDMLIIERLDLDFQPGLNVLTGETGAGKSILLDSLGFVLGWRGRAELVRVGADSGEVTAVFDISGDHPARAVLTAADLPVADELILRRTCTADGRKTARINDRRAGGDVLRALSDCLVELHGQQDDKGLLDPANHRKILDDFGGLSGDLNAVRQVWQALSKANLALDTARAAFAAAQKDEEFLRHNVDEFTKLDPQVSEEAQLDASRRLMQAATRIREDITKAQSAIGASGAEAQLGDAIRWLEEVATQAEGQLDAPLAALGRSLNELGMAQQGVDDCLSAMSFDQNDLETAEERLFAIRALARKHEVQPDELAQFGRDLQAKLAEIEGGEADISTLSDAVKAAQSNYDNAAQKLSTKRQKAAKKLDKAMAGELAPLKMERAVFATEIAAVDPGASGLDRVVFRVATNPGAPSGPINKIASGGELSRFLLALKVCLTSGATGLTMIFDEIDRGVGGATADAVGRRLAEIASGNQVLVVTHSPQVAARGQHHWRVQKTVAKGVTLSTVVSLGGDQRVDELARMLAGDSISDEARAAARVLLEE